MTNEKGYMYKAAMLEDEIGDKMSRADARINTVLEGVQYYTDKFTKILNTFPSSDLPIIAFSLHEMAKLIEGKLDPIDKAGFNLFGALIGSQCISVKIPAEEGK